MPRVHTNFTIESELKEAFMKRYPGKASDMINEYMREILFTADFQKPTQKDLAEELEKIQQEKEKLQLRELALKAQSQIDNAVNTTKSVKQLIETYNDKKYDGIREEVYQIYEVARKYNYITPDIRNYTFYFNTLCSSEYEELKAKIIEKDSKMGFVFVQFEHMQKKLEQEDDGSEIEEVD